MKGGVEGHRSAYQGASLYKRYTRIHPNFTQKLSTLRLWQTSANAFWVYYWVACLSEGSSEGSIKRKASILLPNFHSPPPIRPHPRWPHETWGMFREKSCLAIYNNQFISFFLYHKCTVLRQNFKEPSCSLHAETSETQCFRHDEQTEGWTWGGLLTSPYRELLSNIRVCSIQNMQTSRMQG